MPRESLWEAKLAAAVKAMRLAGVTSGSWVLRDALAVIVAAGKMAKSGDATALRAFAAQAHAQMAGDYFEFPATRRAGLDMLALCLEEVTAGRDAAGEVRSAAARDLKRARAAVREACEWVGMPLPAPAERERIARAVFAEWSQKNARDPKAAARIVLKELGDPQANNAYKADLMRVKRRNPTKRARSNKKR